MKKQLDRTNRPRDRARIKLTAVNLLFDKVIAQLSSYIPSFVPEWEKPIKRSFQGKLKELFQRVRSGSTDEAQPLLIAARPKSKSIAPRHDVNLFPDLFYRNRRCNVSYKTCIWFLRNWRWPGRDCEKPSASPFDTWPSEWKIWAQWFTSQRMCQALCTIVETTMTPACHHITN